MKNTIILIALSIVSFSLFGQTNMRSTNTIALEVLKGNYNPEVYSATEIINHPDKLVSGIHNTLSADSLKSYIIKLSQFKNRNSGSDTVSNNKGIGATRRWVYNKFEEFSRENENRLMTSYLQFDRTMCGMKKHRNVFAVLPGMDTINKGIILIEGHMDSRCESLCDTSCLAEGVEDNATGSALVIELARVMSKYSYNNTIVFMLTIGEEQGLYGAKAFASWANSNKLPIKAVLNNDVVGGIICGATSSPPSCPGLNEIDSTQVRLFSHGGFNSKNKQLVRFIKLQYMEELLPIVSVPMMLTVMSAEDRTGRGGDHIPFRQRKFAAMRFTSANEHGNASISSIYHDRQHTTDDILGVDTDGDSVIDSFFVDFNYLGRNAVINGVAAAMAAIGPITPNFEASRSGDDILVDIEDPFAYMQYRVAIRTDNNDWDTVYTLKGSMKGIFASDGRTELIVSVSSVDTNGIESLFSHEILLHPVGVKNISSSKKTNNNNNNIKLLQNHPNPFDESTIISFYVKSVPIHKNASIRISNMNGKILQDINTIVKEGVNEIWYEHHYNRRGSMVYSLVLDGVIIDSKILVFAN